MQRKAGEDNTWQILHETRQTRQMIMYAGKGNACGKQREKDTMRLISFRKSQSTAPSLSLSRSCIHSCSAATAIANLSAFSQQRWAACWASPCRCRRPRPSPPDRSSLRPGAYPELAWNKNKTISELGFLLQAVLRCVFFNFSLQFWMRLIWLPSTISVEEGVTVTLMYWRLTCFHSTRQRKDNSTVSVNSEICCLAAWKKPQHTMFSFWQAFQQQWWM